MHHQGGHIDNALRMLGARLSALLPHGDSLEAPDSASSRSAPAERYRALLAAEQSVRSDSGDFLPWFQASNSFNRQAPHLVQTADILLRLALAEQAERASAERLFAARKGHALRFFRYNYCGCVPFSWRPPGALLSLEGFIACELGPAAVRFHGGVTSDLCTPLEVGVVCANGVSWVSPRSVLTPDIEWAEELSIALLTKAPLMRRELCPRCGACYC